MSTYNSKLQTNNSSLEDILQQINNLPDKGTGGEDVSSETTEYTTKLTELENTITEIENELKTKGTPAIPTPTISVSSSGLITATAGDKSATQQLSTQAAKTVTPTTSSQTAVASGKYTTGAITVGAIPSSYVKPSATKSATTYTPSTSNQTIAAGTYCSGAQTIKGDVNLKAENIKSGISIFGITGTASGSDNLETVTSELETKVANLNAILEGKASGGAGGTATIPTCTVEIVSKNGQINAGAVVRFINNEVVPSFIGKYINNDETGSLTATITDVICNSPIIIRAIPSYIIPAYSVENATYKYLDYDTWYFISSTTPNTISKIEIRDDD